MTEEELYHRHLRHILKSKGCFFRRVEQESFPDVYAAKDGRTLWIELKVINDKARDGGLVKPKWRPGQLSWIMEHRKTGGDSIILCLWYVGKVYMLYPKAGYRDHELKIYEEDYLWKTFLKGR